MKERPYWSSCDNQTITKCFTWIVFGNFFWVSLMMLNNNNKQSNEYQIITYCQNNHLWLPADTKTMIRWLAVILTMSVIYVHFKVPNIIFLWRIYYFWLIESSKHHINLYHLFFKLLNCDVCEAWSVLHVKQYGVTYKYAACI